MTPEKQLEHETLRALSAFADVLVMRNSQGNGFTGDLAHRLCPACRKLSHQHRIAYGLGVGSPDLVAVVDGTFLGLELKSAKGRLSPEQERWHAAAVARGVLVHEIRSVEDAVRAVEGARR